MEEIKIKLDELIQLLNKDEKIISLKKLKQKLLENSELLEKINKLNQLDIYSNEYKDLKKELFEDENFVEFKHLENEINILILGINQKLKPLIDERGCHNESN